MSRVLLLLLQPCLLICQIMPVPSVDPVRAAEFQQKVMLARNKQPQVDMQARQRIQQREFADKFNQLIEAINGFANRYNEGKGNVWPRREADKLRKAWRQMEQLEKS